MDIKARVCKKENAQCNCCLKTKDNVLDIFEINIPLGSENMSQVLRLCDSCINKLFVKTLKCICYTNSRLKSQHDLSINNSRRTKRYKEEHGEDDYNPINLPVTQKSEESEWDKVIEEYGE